MKYSKTLLLAGSALWLLTGCDRNSDTGTTSTTTSTSQTETRPTSRDTTASPRVYGSDTNGANAVDADNTGRNKRDRSDATLTPGDQGNSEADREMTRNIRRAITSNDKLSTSAKNIKIITQDGKVTLRGPVMSQDEKQTVESLVKQAGVTSFDDQIEVKEGANH